MSSMKDLCRSYKDVEFISYYSGMGKDGPGLKILLYNGKTLGLPGVRYLTGLSGISTLCPV